MDIDARDRVARGDGMFERGIVGKTLVVTEPDDNRRKGQR